MESSVAGWCAELDLVGVVDETTVKSAYRRQMLTWHPDRHHGDPAKHAQAEQKAKAINLAYEHLTEALEVRSPLGHAGPRPVGSEGARTWTSGPAPQHVYRKRAFTPGFPDPAVFEVFVKSSNILSVGYSVSARVLYIKFFDGGSYRYFDVPEATFADLLNASSHGSFAHRNIYNRFRYEKC
jgi:hypothetical protein